MMRTARRWLILGAVYVAVMAWHHPFKGPLSEAEIQAAFGPRAALLEGSVDPQMVAFLRFLRTDDGKPVYMVNVNATPESTPETEAASRTYGMFMLPRLLARASYPVLSTKVTEPLVNAFGPELNNADTLVVVRYRSRRDFLEVVSTDAFREAVTHKAASLDGWCTAPGAIGLIITVPHMLLTALLLFGLIGTIRDRTVPAAGGFARK